MSKLQRHFYLIVVLACKKMSFFFQRVQKLAMGKRKKYFEATNIACNCLWFGRMGDFDILLKRSFVSSKILLLSDFIDNFTNKVFIFSLKFLRF